MKRVLIIGGGFAGIRAARGLRHADVQVTIVDRANHHLFQPMLYQVATAALSPGDIASPIRAILRKQRNVEVILGEAVQVLPDSHEVRLSDGSSIDYDYLVIAAGASHSYFGHEAWAPLAPGLKRVEDALEIRRRILLAFERAERTDDPDRRRMELTFVIVGGGPTGVEVAGAIAEMRRYALVRDFRHIDSREARVLLLEGGPRILPSYPEKLSNRARRTLERLGVEVHAGCMVDGMTAEEVTAGDVRFPTRTVVWAAGNEATPLVESLDVPLDRQGRAHVAADCSLDGRPEIFVVGDAAAFHGPGRKALPGLAPVAMQMGSHVARVIKADLAGRKRPPFRFHDKGQLAVIGRGRAVADVGHLRFSGFFAWLVWIFVHIAYLIGFRNRIIVLIEWGWSYFTFQRGARLITGAVNPPGRPGGASP